MGKLTDDALESMGCTRITEAEPLEAIFHCFSILQVQGFNTNGPSPTKVSGTVDGIFYEVAYGDDLNEIWRILLDSSFIAGEDPKQEFAAWMKENKCSPPFIVVHIDTKTPQLAKSGWYQENGEFIHTHNCFIEIIKKIHAQLQPALAKISAAINIAFFSETVPVRFRRIQNSLYGVTEDNRFVHEMRFSMSAKAYTVRTLSTNELHNAMTDLPETVVGLDSKVSELISTALNEEDRLKRFLFLYFAIERAVETTFDKHRRLPYSTPRNIDLGEELNVFVEKLKATPASKITDLKPKFLWCFWYIWDQLERQDIETFIELKTVRDDLAHGVLDVPYSQNVVAAENLLFRIHLT